MEQRGKMNKRDKQKHMLKYVFLFANEVASKYWLLLFLRYLLLPIYLVLYKHSFKI